MIILILLSMLTACNHRSVSDRLGEIDSLVAEEHFDSAYALLNDIQEIDMLTKEDMAHYWLLSTQLGCITDRPVPPDSLLDKSIEYYNKVGNHQKMTDAYYYKSCKYRKEADYPTAILYAKKAEQLASRTTDARLQYKVAENLAGLNYYTGNYNLQLDYSKKALKLAQKVNNGVWIIYSYNHITTAFSNLNLFDSAQFYVEKSIPYITEEHNINKPAFLTNIGILYKEKDEEKAKEYLQKALEYGDNAAAMDHLAEILYAEGKKEEAYKLWKKALVVNDDYRKDDIIYSILAYDLEHGKTDEACEKLDEIIFLKDSMFNKLKNDTIKDLQFRIDQEMAIHEQEKMTGKWQKGVMGTVILILLLITYVARGKYKERIKMQEVQMQINDYMDQIQTLKASGENDSEAIVKLNSQIRKLLDDDAPKLKLGRMLYEDILEGKTIINWKKKDEILFNNYFAAIDYRTVNRLRNIRRKEKLNSHTLFYLLLVEMGKSDGEIGRIMGISNSGVRTLKSRTKPV